jgi:hypothetical protein
MLGIPNVGLKARILRRRSNSMMSFDFAQPRSQNGHDSNPLRPLTLE